VCISYLCYSVSECAIVTVSWFCRYISWGKADSSVSIITEPETGATKIGYVENLLEILGLVSGVRETWNGLRIHFVLLYIAGLLDKPKSVKPIVWSWSLHMNTSQLTKYRLARGLWWLVLHEAYDGSFNTRLMMVRSARDLWWLVQHEAYDGSFSTRLMMARSHFNRIKELATPLTKPLRQPKSRNLSRFEVILYCVNWLFQMTLRTLAVDWRLRVCAWRSWRSSSLSLILKPWRLKLCPVTTVNKWKNYKTNYSLKGIIIFIIINFIIITASTSISGLRCGILGSTVNRTLWDIG